MSDEPKPPIDGDRERLQRYLEWRERNERPAQRAGRRRRVRGALTGAAAGLVVVVILAWVFSGSRHSARIARRDAPSADDAPRAADVARVAEATRATPDATGATEAAHATGAAGTSQPLPAPPSLLERAPEAPTPPAPAIRRRARPNARTTARATVPDRVRATPAEESTAPSAAPYDRAPADRAAVDRAPVDRAPASDLAATVTAPEVGREPTPSDRRSSAPAVDTATPSVVPSPTVAPPRTDSPAQVANNRPVAQNPPTAPVAENPPVAPTPPVAQTPVAVAPGTVTSIESKPACDTIGGESPDGRTRGQRVADCVGGWLKSQSQELRDGVKRETDDFRGGVDRMGRALQWLGGKLRRPD